MLVSIGVLLIAVILHEIAHGVVANWCGDDTAKRQGRLSLNPWVHMDILGTILVPGMLIVSGAGFLIGWAKPVPVNMNALRNPLKDMMWVALAGPLINLILALTAAFFLPQFWSHHLLKEILIKSYYINMVLMFFNLIPIPPLDGSRVLAFFLPTQIRGQLYRIERWGILIVFILAYLGFFQYFFQYFYPLINQILQKIIEISI